MTSKYNLYSSTEDGNEINIYALFSIFWLEKWLIFSITVLSTVMTYAYTLSLPDIYKAEVILAPSNENNTNSNALQGLGAIGSIAGINIPSSGSTKSMQALEQLSSFTFFEKKIYPYIFAPDIFASKSWNKSKETLEYKSNIYDKSSNKWIKDKPSVQSLYYEFLKVISVNQDTRTSFIQISIEHESPLLAKEWLNLIVTEINKKGRAEDYKAALAALDYLNTQVNKTANSEIRVVLSDLIKNQTQKLLLIEESDEYVFKILNPPFRPEFAIGPKRFLMSVIAGLIGFFISLLASLLVNLLRKKS